jgi:hypothetical protein
MVKTKSRKKTDTGSAFDLCPDTHLRIKIEPEALSFYLKVGINSANTSFNVRSQNIGGETLQVI